MKFVVQLVNLDSGLFQGLLANGGDLVDPSLAPSNCFEGRLQQAAALQTMQERVKSSGANAVSVMRQLLQHGQSKDWLV